MNAPSKSPLGGMLENMRQATETGLKLQQEMFLGWTRFWPGFTGRRIGEPTTLSRFHDRWSSAILDVARTQRSLFDTQFGAAIASLDSMMGFSRPPGEAGTVDATSVSQVTEKDREELSEPSTAPASVESTAGVNGRAKNIYQKVALVTGAASGIGAAVARELADRGARTVLLIDRSDEVHAVATEINDSLGRAVTVAKIGDTTDEAFRKRVFHEAAEEHGLVSICVPAAGITRDALSVRIDKATGRAEVYPLETFRQVTEVNLLAPIYWGIEMVARMAEDRAQRGLPRWDPEERIQGVVVFLGSVSSQGNKGQIAYAVSKAGLEGAAATLQKEAIFHGVRCGIIHPGFTDTPMVRAMGEDYLDKNVLPYTQLRRLIRPEEIADAICFMISNSAVSGELWADAGWHPPA